MFRFIFILLCFALEILSPNFSNAQDYPYESATPTNENSNLPKESPQPVPQAEAVFSKPGPGNSILRTQFKFGVNWSWVQVPLSNQALGSTTRSGLGIEGLLGFFWDLKNQPLSLELESGYKGIQTFEAEKLHSIPLGMGFYFRSRSGPRSLARFGFKSGLEYRYTPYLRGDGTQGLSWGLNPFFALAAPMEFSGFLIEPVFQINRIQTDLTFISTSLRLGFVF